MVKFKAAFKRVRKAVAVVVAGSVVILLRKVGVEVANDDVQTIIEFLFVTGVVYAAPANVKDDVRDILKDEDEDGEA